MWLLKLFDVHVTLNFFDKTILNNSFEVVFPFEPVKPITGILNFDLWYFANSCKVSKVFFTLIAFSDS